MSDKIRTVIVDDHEDSQDVLHHLLGEHEDIEVVAMAENADKGIQKILDKLPDLVFLDVQMPGKSGLDLLEDLKKNGYMTKVVFTTGYHDYAIEAIRQRAFDYLLKPIDRDELAECLTRLRIELRRTGQEVTLLGKTSVSTARLKFNTRSGFILIDPDEVVYCKADGNYTHIYTGEKTKETVSVQLGKIEPVLKNTGLVRAGKSHIVNINLLKVLDRKAGTCAFEKNGKCIPLELPSTALKQLGEVV